jgi:D-alanine-D-alanine ligase
MEHKGKMIVLPICEIVSKNEFFDYEAKYNPALADEIVPANIETKLEIEIKHSTAMIYKKLNCRGIVRADYIYCKKTDTLYFIEINTVPGLTHESIVPKMAREMGIALPELFAMAIEDALVRAHR